MSGEALLRTEALEVRYGAICALQGVSLDVRPGEIVTLIGSNGAGKSTLLRAISGLIAPARGSIRFEGSDVTGARPDVLVALGISHVPEGRRIFANLSVRENLQMGAYLRPKTEAAGLERVLALFPRLRERLTQAGGTLSGGEQQMLAIGRGLMGNPRLLLVDEVSLGLAPVVVRDIYRVLRTIAAEGTSTLVVDQDVSQIMELAQRVYCFRKGTVSLEGRPADLTRARIAAAYFGV